MKIEWHSKAEDNFVSIILYIKKDSPKYSLIFAEKIFNALENISLYNKLGKIVYEFNNENIREIDFWSYRVIYEIHKDKIVILGILHSKRNLDFKE